MLDRLSSRYEGAFQLLTGHGLECRVVQSVFAFDVDLKWNRFSGEAREKVRERENAPYRLDRGDCRCGLQKVWLSPRGSGL